MIKNEIKFTGEMIKRAWSYARMINNGNAKGCRAVFNAAMQMVMQEERSKLETESKTAVDIVMENEIKVINESTKAKKTHTANVCNEINRIEDMMYAVWYLHMQHTECQNAVKASRERKAKIKARIDEIRVY